MASGKPNVLILGGLNICAKSLAGFLVPPAGEPLVANVRIADKFSVAPPTTYVGSEFPQVLDKPNVEYRQANLTLPDAISSVFDPPEGQAPYDYVFDLSGDTRHDRGDEFQVKHTFNPSRLIGLEAARRKVKAYVRLTHPFYAVSDTRGGHTEDEDLRPEDMTGHWWHETLRALAAIDDLNLVILRIGLVYGPYVNYGQISSLIQVSAVYGYMKKPMKALHKPGKHAVHTVHIDDVSAALWACAGWMAPLGRAQADTAAGEPIPSRMDQRKIDDGKATGYAQPGRRLTAPLFNLVDDSETTWVKAGTTATAVFGTTFEFFNLMMDVAAKFNLEDQVEEINDHHVSSWNEMLKASNPRIEKTPLLAWMDVYDLHKHVVSLSNAKAKRVLGLTLRRPAFGEAEIREVVDKWKAERIWPTV